MRTDPHTRIQRQTRQPLCQNQHSHQHPHPTSPSAGHLRPARHSREEPRHRGSSLRLLAKLKAAQLAPAHIGQPCKARNVPLPGRRLCLKSHACAVRRAWRTPGTGRFMIRRSTRGIWLFQQRSSKRHWLRAVLSQETAGENAGCLTFSTQHPPAQRHGVNPPHGCAGGLKPPPRATFPASGPRAAIHTAPSHAAGCQDASKDFPSAL